MSTDTPRHTLVREVVCPNCWERFPPERLRYVSTHHDLFGDLRLGDLERRRFLPTRFHPDGRALDAKGSPCHELACPRCHLGVPRVLVERPTFFISMFGSPKSGKSYLLAAMIHRLRRLMPKAFAMDFSDPDPLANAVLHGYEDTLFSWSSPDELVFLKKTDVVGEWYQKVNFGQKEILYPKPFFFQIGPVAGHPLQDDPEGAGRTLCIYDNAGESFQPGEDRPDNPVTQHMAKSNCMLFVYDPTQEPEFRRQLQALSADEQIRDPTVLSRQEVLLAEAARRVKVHRGMHTTDRHDRPLLVLVNKYDAWQKLVGDKRLPDPWVTHPSGKFSVLRLDMIQRVSDSVRALLKRHTSEIVSTAESFVDPQRIIYMPVSATGGPPARTATGSYAHRAGSINPMWVEVPILYLLSQYGRSGRGGGGVIPFVRDAITRGHNSGDGGGERPTEASAAEDGDAAPAGEPA